MTYPYKFGWELTPEMQALEEHRLKVMERLERERLRDLRKQEIALGVVLFLWVLVLLVPLITRLLCLSH